MLNESSKSYNKADFAFYALNKHSNATTPMSTSFYTDDELIELGFKSLGIKVLISRKCSIYGAANISIGDNVRIDDFCILSGLISLKSHIHIGAGTHLYGGPAGIIMEDFSCLSGRCAIYAISDDYSGSMMANATIPQEYTAVESASVTLGKHTLVGTGSTILPGVHLAEGVAVGAMSLVNKSLSPWALYAGIPVKMLQPRSKEMLKQEALFLQKWAQEQNN